MQRSALANVVIAVIGAAGTLLAATGASAAPPDSSSPADTTDLCEPRAAGGMSDPSSTQSELPSWQTLEIVDVDGASFTLADCIGTPVLVETFATWCSNCRQQLPKTQEAAATLGENAAVIALSVETDLAPDAVAEYAVDNELPDIRFAVMSPELLAALVEEFGPTVANPPSTPKIVIDAAGTAGELTTGQESVEDLVAQLTAAASAELVATTTG